MEIKVEFEDGRIWTMIKEKGKYPKLIDSNIERDKTHRLGPNPIYGGLIGSYFTEPALGKSMSLIVSIISTWRNITPLVRCVV